MAQALYRKYRSRSFGEVIGQDHVTKTIERAIQQGKISHAYLFTGPRGVGKTSIARILAHAINQLEYSDTPHLDIIEIDAASNRRIEDIRDLREKVHLAPISAPYKIYIIDEVHMLTTESFNALLKTLEEPPAHVIFILATTELHKLPATITSRTQRFAFRPPSAETIIGHLQTIAKKEKLHIEDAALALIAEHADGGFRDSISLLDQARGLNNKGETITEAAVADLLGLPPRSQIETLFAASVQGDVAASLTRVKELESNGLSSASIASSLLKLAVEKLVDTPQAAGLIEKLTEVSRSSHPAASLRIALLQNQPLPTPRAQVVTIVEKKNPVEVIQTEKKDSPLPEELEKPKTQQEKKTAENPSTTTKPANEPAPTDPKPAAPHPATKQPNANNADVTIITNQWGDILATVKKRSVPLYGTLRNAEIRTGDNGELLLVFKFPLHRRKIDDSKHKLVLVSAIAEVVGANTIEIITDIDTAAEPTPANSKPPETSAEARAIMDVMGGGEVVHPPTA